MRKIVVLNRVSIDGYFASPNEASFGMDWFVPDPEVDVAVREGRSADTLLMGRITYEGFERSWVPRLNDPATPPPLKAVAEELTRMNKVVFSTTLKPGAISWANTELHGGDLEAVVREVKERPGTDILIFGSGSLVQQLTRAGLIDTFVLIESPVIAGGGKPLFAGLGQTGLTLVNAQGFKSGNVVLQYEVRR